MLPSVTMASGSLAAMTVLEDKFRPDREKEEAKTLVGEATAADLGSGSSIDLNKLGFPRPFSVTNKKGTQSGRYRCEKGTSAVLSEKATTLEIEVLEETVRTMDTSSSVCGCWMLPWKPGRQRSSMEDNSV